MDQILPFIFAFFGGIFGAAIGGAASFVLFGFLAIIGIASIIATGSDVFLNSVALSPIFGPQAAFIGGVAAAAFTGKLSRDGKLLNADGSPSEPFGGGDIFSPLVGKGNIAILLVGGIFGAVGFGTLYILDALLGFGADNIGVSVLLTNILIRILFGDAELVSDLPPEVNKVSLIFENLAYNVLWTFSLSVVIATVIDVIQFPLFGFVLGAFSLIFIMAGLNFPMIHHVAFIAGLAMQVTGNIWIAGLFGVIAFLLGNTFGVFLNANTKSHIDPPAGAIAILSFILLTIL